MTAPPEETGPAHHPTRTPHGRHGRSQGALSAPQRRAVGVVEQRKET